MPLHRRVRDQQQDVLELLEEAGRNAHRAASLLRELLGDFPEHGELAGELFECEQAGDRLTHDIIHRINGGRRTRPYEPADLYDLARGIDDIVDYAEQTGDELGLYGVEATMEQALALADVLMAAAGQVAASLAALRAGRDTAPHLVEVNRLENEGDRLSRDAVASLFANGIDPMVVVRWKDIFASLEQAVDACETVAHVLEGMTIKRARRR